MTESIQIKNFGPLKNIQIDKIKPFTVLIGESGSGKSTLMKLLALCRWLYKMYNIRSYLQKSKISKSPFRFRMDTYVKNCGFDQYIQSDTEIVYRNQTDSGNRYEIRLTKNKSSLSILPNFKNIEVKDIAFNKISFISETRNIIPLWADRGASFTGSYLGYYFHETYKDFDLATETIKDMDMSFLDVKFKVKKKGSLKNYSIFSTGTESFEIDFKNSSSGTQTSVPILLISEYFSKYFKFEDAFNRSVLAYLSNIDELESFRPVKNLEDISKKIFIHIEEPELSLFPNAQCELMNKLLSNCFAEKVNLVDLFVSTHSPYFINHLNLLIKAFDTHNKVNGASFNYDQLAVYQVVEGELENLMVKNERLVNTNPLSETINMIYDQYNALGK
ncbi:MAG TPA: ATP-binding protein [Spirochaetia bacterium]|nr:MAG: hypothetical protein A2Y41_00770 [Spirochaetes bacterium GWB1_36_13]HCL56702.1 ATP-binding protein [Spirochaetia bacterium]